ncbi:MAG: hypothetical protein GY797_20800 [Deltaproteobacteria bacterium]|nr:hypothetical protein [Deltaproteobacteria bacterium]
MTTSRSHPQKMTHWWVVIVVVAISMLRAFTGHINEEKRQRAREDLTSIHPQKVTSFKIHPNKTFTDDYHDAIEFIKEKQILIAFFQAINDIQPYKPQHDRTAAQWGIQISTETNVIRIGCYIPDLKPKVVAGRIFSESGTSFFQSSLLLHWYQKYGHYWEIGDYQKEQYSRVIPVLKSIYAQDITSFTLLPGVSESSEMELVAEFFQSLEDMQFAASIHKEFMTQWGVQIDTSATTVKLECFIPADDPTLVVGLIDSHEGYTYFQSRKLLQWYQKYKDRWLKPDGKKGLNFP